jgi:hypothetical protein
MDSGAIWAHLRELHLIQPRQAARFRKRILDFPFLKNYLCLTHWNYAFWLGGRQMVLVRAHFSNLDAYWPQGSESCIRGHRSSKCAHFDRPMKRIPKAGRPLANCTHINGANCHCREVWAIMVPLAPGIPYWSLDWRHIRDWNILIP